MIAYPSHAFGQKNPKKIATLYNDTIARYKAEIELKDLKGSAPQILFDDIVRQIYPADILAKCDKKIAKLQKFRARISPHLLAGVLFPKAKCPYCSSPIRFVSKSMTSGCSTICTNQLRYGVDNPSQTEEVKSKIKETFSKYKGGHPQRDPEVIARKEQTCLDRYGVTSLLSSNDFRLNKSTMLKKYGVEYPLQNKSILKASRKTNLERYGTTSPSKSEKIKAKTRQTNLDKYGVEGTSQDPTIRELQLETLISRYGVDNPFKNPDVIAKCIATSKRNHDGMHHTQHPDVLAKIRKTHLAKYGVTHPMKNIDYFLKVQLNSFNKVKSGNIGRRKFLYQGYEDVVFKALVSVYGSKDIFTQFDKKFDHTANQLTGTTPDLFIKSINTYVEVKSTWTLFGKGGKGKTSFLTKNKHKQRLLSKQGISCRWVVVLNQKKGIYVVLPLGWENLTKPILKELMCPR